MCALIMYIGYEEKIDMCKKEKIKQKQKKENPEKCARGSDAVNGPAQFSKYRPSPLKV